MKLKLSLGILAIVLISLITACSNELLEPDDGLAELFNQEQFDGEIQQTLNISIDTSSSLKSSMIRSELIEGFVGTLPSGKTVRGVLIKGDWEGHTGFETLKDIDVQIKMRPFTIKNGNKLLAGVALFPNQANRDPVPILISRENLVDIEGLPRQEITDETVSARLVLQGNTAAGILTERNSKDFIGIVIGETTEEIRVIAGDSYVDDVRISMTVGIETKKSTDLFSLQGTIYLKSDDGTLELPTGGLLCCLETTPYD